MITITAGRSHFVLVGVVCDENRFISTVSTGALHFLRAAQANVYCSHFPLQVFVLSGESHDHVGLVFDLGLRGCSFVSSERFAEFLFLPAL